MTLFGVTWPWPHVISWCDMFWRYVLCYQKRWDRGRWVGAPLWVTVHGGWCSWLYRKALVNAGRAICLLSCKKQAQKMLLLPCRDSISSILGNCQSGGVFSGWRALTIERLLMSGCGKGREPTENVSIKLWLKFSVLAPSRRGNTDQGRLQQQWSWCRMQKVVDLQF